MKVSVVITYYNRPRQLSLTLETISQSKLRDELEIVCVDDGSSPDQKAETVLKTSGLNFNYTYIDKKDKTWINPCVAYNMGFRKAIGEVIIIQNAECFHVGDLVEYSYKHTQGNYLVYSCKNVKEPEMNQLQKKRNNRGLFDQHVNLLRNQRGSWYNHPINNPRKYHFTSSISKENLKALSGFDERYAAGYCFDDDEFLVRVERSPFPLIMVPPDDVFSVHQWHPSSLPKLGNQDPLWKRNHNLFKSVTLKETQWKAN